ncbi:adenosine deaminase [Glaciecola sp. 2405UD65-10]|uniref:adenosine deaminase n=1 Tax=Glaciecola sp. 2405UD65-10 TaxID=3397244 RepID=UPI003B5B5210
MSESKAIQSRLESLIQALPKTELHLHIEGSLEPQLMWDLAQKHGVSLAYSSVDDIKDAYQFEDLQSFLDLYYQGASVLLDEDDFYQLMWAYLCKCNEQHVVHTEIMFDPQTHTERGIEFSVFMKGFERAIKQAENEFGMSVYLIMSFLRHLSEDSAFACLAQAKPYYNMIKALGLDSSELGNPPSKFERVFKQGKELGFLIVAHAGEEGPADYVWEAIRLLDVDRIDHGVRSSEDPSLMEYLKTHQIPLTVCPLSNLKLCVVNDMAQHNILDLLDMDLMVMVNSDDPSYFGGYLNENYLALLHNLPLTEKALVKLVKNSFSASFLPKETKREWIAKIDSLL